MRRGVNAEETRQLIRDFRSALPDVSIRTAFIVGYPGETEEEFEELLQFIVEERFDRVGVFTYSHEDDTHAFKLEDSVPESVKHERAARLMEIQEQISRELNQEKIGRVLTVLIDRQEGDYMVGRSEYDSPEIDNEVLIKDAGYLKIGEFCSVKIIEADEFELYGSVTI